MGVWSADTLTIDVTAMLPILELYTMGGGDSWFCAMESTDSLLDA